MGARFAVGDLISGAALAGLLVPEAVAYAGVAGLPPQAGVVALFAGLLAYALAGSSRFAMVSATSSSATVLLAATSSLAPGDAVLRAALASGLVLLAGGFFMLAAAARLGAVSSLVAKPVLRGFAFGLALTIVLKQLPHVLGVHALRNDFFRLAWELAAGWRHWRLADAAVGLAALALLHGLGRWRAVPAALLVIALGIVLDASGLSRAWGVPAVGPIALAWPVPGLPGLARAQWLSLVELAFALALILYAESYGAIRTFALRHGDPVSANRDLFALGLGNLVSGLLRGMPVGAGYSATAANEAAGAQSRACGLVAAAVVGVAVLTLLPWIAHTPEPVLAAIVIHAVGHSLSPGALRPYFVWRRDRVVVGVAVAAVLLLGVLNGLLAAIGVSLLMLLRSFARTRVSWLGSLDGGRDYVDTARHPDARVPPGLLIARPEVPLFFGNADAVFATLHQQVTASPGLRALVLSLEDSGDLDGTSIEALRDFATWMQARGTALRLARVKDTVRDLLAALNAPELPPAAYAAWSVDDAVQAAGATGPSA